MTNSAADDLSAAIQPSTHIGKASFSVSSRVALQLGRESISSSITALVELVKNAYDADAEEIRLRFAKIGTDEAFLVIEDTGEGMSVDNLRDYWMVIGTSNKTERKKTKKQRVVTGEKGLGRLGLDRLCARTELESIRLGASEGIRLDVQWEKYEENHNRLESVEHDLYSIPNLRLDPITGKWNDYPKGTRLILRELKDDWNEDSIRQLRNELALLVSPFQGINDFTIKIDTQGKWEDLEGSVAVQKMLLDGANWKVVAELNDEDKMEVTMTSARHDTEYHMKPTPWAEAIKKQGARPHCGPFRFEFYFFVRRDAELTNKTLKANEIVNFLKFNQGIRIYRDGFRVKPYGEPDGNGDWLRLAFRRMQNPEGVSQQARPGSWRVGYNQVVGAAFITHEKNSGLNDQTNREGLLQGKAFDHLYVFALRVIQFFEINNQIFERSRKLERAPVDQAEEVAKTSIEEVTEAIKELGELTSRIPQAVSPPADGAPTRNPVDDDVRRVIGDVQRRLEAAEKGLEISAKLFRDAEEQKNTMANLASLGILAAAFGHETLDWTGTVVKNSNWLLEILPRELLMISPKAEADITEALQDTVNEAQKIRKFARFTLGNLNRDKRQRRDFNLTETVKRVCNAFEEVIRVQRHTEFVLDFTEEEPCLINGFEMDWESIIVNLITNASWALDDKPREERKILLRIFDGDSDWVVAFDDSGVGLETGTEEMVFLPAFSTKRTPRGEVIGTGMGLFIVKSFVQEHSNGTITAKCHGDLGGASFEIRVPKAQAVNKGDLNAEK
jgi:signal transduction histidine kinase